MSKRAVIYRRVSTTGQVEGTSLGEQLTRCQSYAEENGLTVVRDYCDAGLSGASLDRPQWREMLAAAVAGEFEVLLILRLDRFGRGTAFAGEIERLITLGVDVVSVDGGMDYTTDEGSLMLGISSTISGYERRLTFRRTNSGRRAKLRNGGSYAGGDVPYGYEVAGQGRESRVVPSTREREVLALAYDRIVNQGISTPKVCAELDRLGYRPRKAARWSPQVLRRALRHQALVTGENWWGLPAAQDTSARASGRDTKVTADGTPAYGEPIKVTYGNPMFSREEWDALQAALDGKRVKYNPTGEYTRVSQLLTGRVRAVDCDRTYTGVDLRKATKGRQSHVYRCGGRRASLPKEQRCSHSQLDGPLLDQKVWEEVVGFLGDRDRLEAMGRDWLAAQEVEPTQLAQLEQQMSRLTAQRERAVDLLLESPQLTETLTGRVAKLDEQIVQLRSQVAGAQATQQERQQRRAQVSDVLAVVAQAHERLAGMGPQERAEVVRLLDVRVTVEDVYQGYPVGVTVTFEADGLAFSETPEPARWPPWSSSSCR